MGLWQFSEGVPLVLEGLIGCPGIPTNLPGPMDAAAAPSNSMAAPEVPAVGHRNPGSHCPKLAARLAPWGARVGPGAHPHVGKGLFVKVCTQGRHPCHSLVCRGLNHGTSPRSEPGLGVPICPFSGKRASPASVLSAWQRNQGVSLVLDGLVGCPGTPLGHS